MADNSVPRKYKFESETIIFNGIRFRRYPNSSRWSDRWYYRPAANYIKRGVSHLHREIWKSVHGDIPENCEIHHKDLNPLNNNIDNLECLPRENHATLHFELMPEWRKQWIRDIMNNRVRPAASKWHQSEAGREWHRELGYWAWEQRRASEQTCEQCGISYTTKKIGRTRFCSNNCKSAFRRRAGIDDETRTCEQCGKEFICNHYQLQRYCSRLCAARHRKIHDLFCDYCGKAYVGRSKQRFCTKTCKTKWYNHRKKSRTFE